MGSFQPIHWIIVLALLASVGFPIVRILQRTGHSGWWAILYFIPVAGWIGLWIFAYARWPAVDTTQQAKNFET